MEGQRRILSHVAQAGGRIHVDLPIMRDNADDEAEGHERSPTDRRQGHDIRGDTVDLLARMDEVPGARAHEHLNTSGRRHLKGGRHLIESGSQAAARQVGADLDAIRSPVARTARTHSIFHANLNNGHGCHLS